MKSIDLNCDMGEIPEHLADGTQEALLHHISSVNVACGAHAGDANMMRSTIEQALRHRVSVGAHPGYEDRANFGRIELQLSYERISASVLRQLLALDAIAQKCGAHLTHVKPHGALYNQAARDPLIARAIAVAVRRWRSNVALVGLAGSVMLDAFRDAGFPVAAEAFADRRYEKDGSLRSRKFPDALFHDPSQAAEQTLRIVQQASVIAVDGTLVPLYAQTICIHGDTPGAYAIAAAIHRRLEDAGIHIVPLQEQK